MKLRRLCFYKRVSVHTGGGCAASVHAGIPPPPPEQTSPPPRDSHCCRRYASYWNAFLFGFIFRRHCHINWKCVKKQAICSGNTCARTSIKGSMKVVLSSTGILEKENLEFYPWLETQQLILRHKNTLIHLQARRLLKSSFKRTVSFL